MYKFIISLLFKQIDFYISIQNIIFSIGKFILNLYYDFNESFLK